jgi:hypothetical protein
LIERFRITQGSAYHGQATKRSQGEERERRRFRALAPERLLYPSVTVLLTDSSQR